MRIGLFLLALLILVQIPTPTPTPDIPGREERLQSCRALDIEPDWRSDSIGFSDLFNMSSPDGTYVASQKKAGSRGCHWVVIYQCEQHQAWEIGCEGIFPPESSDEVFAQEWASDHELRITRKDEVQVVDAAAHFMQDTLVPMQSQDLDLGLSPDGAWRIFRTKRDGMSELYRMRPDGSEVKRLTYSISIEQFYGWSADGDWIILDYLPNHAAPRLMRVDGSDLHPLFETPGSWNTIALSPDGHWVIVEGFAPAPSEGSNRVFFRASIPDGELTRLTDPKYPYWFEAWSPDGRALVWTGQGKLRSFELINLNTTEITRVFTGNSAEFRGWTEDGLLFTIFDP